MQPDSQGSDLMRQKIQNLLSNLAQFHKLLNYLMVWVKMFLFCFHVVFFLLAWENFTAYNALQWHKKCGKFHQRQPETARTPSENQDTFNHHKPMALQFKWKLILEKIESICFSAILTHLHFYCYLIRKQQKF